MWDAKDSVHRKTSKQQQQKTQRQRENTPDKKKKQQKERVCRGSAADMETFSPRSQKADRELLHFQQRFLTYCQHDSSWIVKAIPEAMVKQHLKTKVQPDAGDVLI